MTLRSRRFPTSACFQATAYLLLCVPYVVAQTPGIEMSKATSLIREGRYDAALSTLKLAITSYPLEPRLLTMEGLAYSLQGDDANALRALDEALRAAPGFAPALKAKAEILTREHRPEAVAVLMDLLKLNPGDTVAREMLALGQAQTGDCAGAISQFSELGPVLDRHPASLAREGGCFFLQGRFADATRVFAQASQLQPANADLLYDLALSQEKAGDSKAALATLAPLLAGDADLDTLTLASDAAEAVGDTPQSVALMRRAIVLDPSLAESYVRFSELCMLHESYEAGIDMVSAGIARLPQSSSLYVARGMLYGGKGEYSRSEADFRTADTLDPTHGTGAFGVGLVQAQSNHPEEALSTARAALTAHPEDARLNFLVARLLVERGEQPGSKEFATALIAAQKAVNDLPDFVAGRDLLAKIYMLQGNMPLAIAECLAALKVDPNDESATYRLLSASRQVGDRATVKELSKRVAEQHQQARSDEAKRLRYRIVDAASSLELPKSEGAAP